MKYISFDFFIRDIDIKEENESGNFVWVFQENNLLVVKVAKTVGAEVVSSWTSLTSELISGVICWLDGLFAGNWTKSLALLLVGGCFFELEDADLNVIRWNGGIDNVAVLVVAAKSVVEPVVVSQLESRRSEAGQSEEKVDEFHFSFLCFRCFAEWIVWWIIRLGTRFYTRRIIKLRVSGGQKVERFGGAAAAKDLQ